MKAKTAKLLEEKIGENLQGSRQKNFYTGLTQKAFITRGKVRLVELIKIKSHWKTLGKIKRQVRGLERIVSKRTWQSTYFQNK